MGELAGRARDCIISPSLGSASKPFSKEQPLMELVIRLTLFRYQECNTHDYMDVELLNKYRLLKK